MRQAENGARISIESLKAVIDGKINEALDSLAENGPENGHPYISGIYKWGKRYLGNGGKRLHGVSVILAYFSCGGTDMKKIGKVAAGLQLYHHHTLIHDDIYDEDHARRGIPAAHVAFAMPDASSAGNIKSKFGVFINGAARLGAVSAFAYGKIIHSLAFRLLFESGFPCESILCAANALARHDAVDNTAQALDVYHEGRSMFKPDECIKIAELKTGRLFETCADVGAMLAGGSPKQAEALKTWARLSAVAYQLKDDLEDIYDDSEKGLGRGAGSDVLKQKPAYLFAMAVKTARGGNADVLKRWVKTGFSTVGKEDVIRAIKSGEGPLRTEEKILELCDGAVKSLENALPPFHDAAREALVEYVSYVVSEDYWRRPMPADYGAASINKGQPWQGA